MAEAAKHQTPRRFTRIAFHRPAVLEARAVRAECELLDVSLKGALVEVGPGLALQAGDACSLVIRLDAGDALIRMDGTLARVDGQRVGVRVQELELESAEHLRRLVEVNLGDEELLHRELAAMVAERAW
jgi:PilZ domain